MVGHVGLDLQFHWSVLFTDGNSPLMEEVREVVGFPRGTQCTREFYKLSIKICGFSNPLRIQNYNYSSLYYADLYHCGLARY